MSGTGRKKALPERGGEGNVMGEGQFLILLAVLAAGFVSCAIFLFAIYDNLQALRTFTQSIKEYQRAKEYAEGHYECNYCKRMEKIT